MGAARPQTPRKRSVSSKILRILFVEIVACTNSHVPASLLRRSLVLFSIRLFQSKAKTKTSRHHLHLSAKDGTDC